VLVHVWNTSRNDEGSQLLGCNCSSLLSDLSEGSHSPGRCGIDLGKIAPPKQEATYSTFVPQYLLYPTGNSHVYPATLVYDNTSSFYGSYAMATPPLVYLANHYGMPVNVQPGTVLTEARGIFIRNLSFKCTTSDLFQLLLTVGHSFGQRLITHSRTGVLEGAATAMFATQEEAQQAAQYLHGVKHMGMTLSVRIDKENNGYWAS
jgi:hypothetical protein